VLKLTVNSTSMAAHIEQCRLELTIYTQQYSEWSRDKRHSTTSRQTVVILA